MAHNADFDRAFVEKRMPLMRDKLWACSYRQINWRGKGFTDSKLPDLSHAHGFYVDSHRALEDVNAAAYLLSKRDSSTNAPFFKELLDGAFTPSVRIEIEAARDESKEIQLRGYTWSDYYKRWYKYVPVAEQASETQWLGKNFYHGTFNGLITPVAPVDRFRYP